MDLEFTYSPEPDAEEATPTNVEEEVWPGTLEEQFPFNKAVIVDREQVVQSKSGDDKEEFNNIPTDIVEDNKDKGANQRIRSRRLPFFTSRREARKMYK